MADLMELIDRMESRNDLLIDPWCYLLTDQIIIEPFYFIVR